MSGPRKDEARRWFHQAFYDLKAARWNAQGGFFDTASFLSQQSAEKALKSLLYYIGARRSALLTHSLTAMLEVIPENSSIRQLGTEARELDLHYIPSRYPNGLPDGFPHQFYDREIGARAVAAAEKIFCAVEGFYKERNEEDILLDAL